MAYRYRRTRMTPRERQAAAAVVAGLVLAGAVSGHASAHSSSRTSHSSHTGRPDRAARTAIAYAEHQIGCPYVYGGTGPCSAGYDWVNRHQGGPAWAVAMGLLIGAGLANAGESRLTGHVVDWIQTPHARIMGTFDLADVACVCGQVLLITLEVHSRVRTRTAVAR